MYTTTMLYTAWAHQQIARALEGDGSHPGREMSQLLGALAAVRGKSGMIFGLVASKLEPEGYASLEAVLVPAILERHARLVAARDFVWLYDLDAWGKSLDLPELRLTARLPLRCDPLGTRDGLSSAWSERLALLDDAIAGRRALDWSKLAIVGYRDDDPAPASEFGPPDMAALYEYALHTEARSGRAFAREIAAFMSTANGIWPGGDMYLSPVKSWSAFAGDDVRIGSGGYSQGQLVLEPGPDGTPFGGRVVDRRDGEECAVYASFGALVDLLLARPPASLRR